MSETSNLVDSSVAQEAFLSEANPTQTTNTVPQTNQFVEQKGYTDEDLKRVREQEKSKLYPQIDSLKEEINLLKKEREDRLAEVNRMAEEKAAEAKAAAEADMDVRSLLEQKEKEWADKFTAAGVPIVGDDIKSQVGATITHRVLAKLFEDRGVTVDRTYQLNVGGNMDFMNMLERDRLESKKISKTQSVTSQLRDKIDPRNVHIGPSDYVAWLDDRKWAFVRLEGRAFGDVPLSLEYKLEVWDSPNSAGVIIDAIRACKIAKDRGIGGPILSASSYFMKSPPVQYDDSTCRQEVEDFIAGK